MYIRHMHKCQIRSIYVHLKTPHFRKSFSVNRFGSEDGKLSDRFHGFNGEQWHRSDIAETSQWHRSDIAVTSQWHRSVIAVTSQCHCSDIAVTSQWHRSDIAVTLQWHCSDIAVTSQRHRGDRLKLAVEQKDSTPEILSDNCNAGNHTCTNVWKEPNFSGNFLSLYVKQEPILRSRFTTPRVA
jgi:hypothetical protein